MYLMASTVILILSVEKIMEKMEKILDKKMKKK